MKEVSWSERSSVGFEDVEVGIVVRWLPLNALAQTPRTASRAMGATAMLQRARCAEVHINKRR